MNAMLRGHTTLPVWLAGAMLACGLASPARADIIYSAANDFSLASNPNGVWSYGYENTLGASLQLYDIATTNARGTVGLDQWSSSLLGGDPHVIHNRTNTDLTFGSVTVPA